MNYLHKLILLTATMLIFRGSGWTKEFSSTVSMQDQKELAALKLTLGYDSRSERFSRPYSESNLDALVGGIHASAPDARNYRLKLLSAYIEQFNISPATLKSKVFPAVQPYTNKEDGADLIWWQVSLRTKANDQERFQLLKDSVHAKNQLIAEAAINALSELDSKDAEAVLADQGESRKGRPGGKRHIDLAAGKIALRTKLKSLPPSAAITTLKQEIESRKRKDLVSVWAVRKLEQINSAQAAEALKGVWSNQSLDESVRYEAQEALVRMGKIRVKERTLIYQ